ncbi:MAG TPA: hypothetical protein VK121_07435 [Pseudogracilibacillus sp.]|nr:hypothetical protein [Pseudogracilibacillus sp.]
MKLTKTLVTGLVFIMLLVSCSNKAFDDAMANGKAALENEAFAKAELSFEDALKHNSNDEEAKRLLKQTKQIIEAEKLLDNGRLKDAKVAYQEARMDKGSPHINTHAKHQLSEINQVTNKYEEIAAKLDEIEQLKTEQKYEESLALVEQTIQTDLSHQALKPLNDKLTDLQVELEIAIKESEENAKKQALINQTTGYWQYIDNEFEFCEFTSDHFVCAVAASDIYFYNWISEWDVNLTTQTVTITTDIGSTGTIHFPHEDLLTFGEDNYRRVSESEVRQKLAEIGIDDVDEFFNIHRYEEWDNEHDLII